MTWFDSINAGPPVLESVMFSENFEAASELYRNPEERISGCGSIG